MQLLRTAAALAAAASFALAQDRITLTNGDVLTGAIKTMADGKVTFSSPSLGDVTVPLANITDMATQGQVELLTLTGETYKRRIAGIEDRRLKLEGDLPALAIDNLGKINPPPTPPPQWVGTAKLGAIYADGNTERRAVNASFEASRRSEIDRLTFDASWDYGQDKNQATGEWNLTQRRTGGGLKYDYFLSKRWYGLANARVLGDTLADLRLRFTGGLGVGYTVIENADTTLVTEAGLSYFNENYRSDNPSQDYMAARVAYRLTHSFSATTKLIHGVEAFPSLENADDIYLQVKTEVVTSLTDNMIASLAHIMDYDNTPSPGVGGNRLERADHRVLLTVGWSF